MAAYNSAGLVPLVIWAATVEPAEVPMMRSASVTSTPASASPAMRPSSQALPAAPPPARTSARSVVSTCWCVVSMGVAFREWAVDGSGDGRRWSVHAGAMTDEPSTGPQPGTPHGASSGQMGPAAAPETYVWPLVALGVVI